MTMSSLEVPLLVSTSWLNEQLETAGSDLRVLDATWTYTGQGKQAYLSKHIPGAQHFDLNRGIKPRPTCARNLPDPEGFQDYMRSLGICDHTHIVFYDNQPMFYATKAWWTLKVFGHERVSVLDGGLVKWVADGYDITIGEDNSDTKIGNFEVKMQRSRIAEYADVIKIAQSGSAQLVDVRKEEHFDGTDAEPCTTIQQGLQSMAMPLPDTMKRGHIPGSVQLWRNLVLDSETNCFLVKDKLLKLLSEHGVDMSNSRPLITVCYMGHTATLLNMTLELCGRTDSSLYYGSWTEYGQLAAGDEIEISK